MSIPEIIETYNQDNPMTPLHYDAIMRHHDATNFSIATHLKALKLARCQQECMIR